MIKFKYVYAKAFMIIIISEKLKKFESKVKIYTGTEGLKQIFFVENLE